MELAILAEDLFETPTEAESSVAEKIIVSDEVFAKDFNRPLIHQAVTTYFSNGRCGTRKQKSRSDVRGGGAKPYRQKGTGRARAGSNRSPLWRGGGVTFAARPKSYARKLNRKMYRGALRSIVSELVRQGRFVVVADFSATRPKTRDIVDRLGKLGLESVLIVTEHLEDNLNLSVRNLKWVGAVEVDQLDPVSLIKYEKVLITVSGLRQFEERLK
uniref:Large ribosomal subunit protein uL4 n=1 Tax=Candidatus Kentrum sp. LPFa TaxID=2126335 RepID=A0A450VXP4_9GAMM|nr:MAG: LSU ribosomal protein L4P [Candidatus Kentron sp. LPFa]VFK13964.1 MAG: LSU ribosomal protein L4P [Candidatus Kentron sp. LPFa]VFK25522.1 MAG: LSU ribosomal protein L4P [Candidatus Kentron sp. LPFa]